MANNVFDASRSVAHELIYYSSTIKEEYREDHFDPRNRDEWVKRFCEWLSAKQRKSAEVRASND
jgi:hypothetical protein